MIDWIRRLFEDETAPREPDSVDPELLLELRDELQECGALYLVAAEEIARENPEWSEAECREHRELLLDLQRGLLAKLFIEIAVADRRWDPAERDMAHAVLHHLWGKRVPRAHLSTVLRNTAEKVQSLRWQALVEPFVTRPSLSGQAAELYATTIRIANLIAKADGKLLPSEEARLKAIQTEMEGLLSRREIRPTRGARLTTRPGRATEAVAVKQVPESLRARGDRQEVSQPCEPPPQKSPREMLEEALAELNRLVGLKTLKSDIRELINFLRIQKSREQHQLPRTSVSLHAIFSGNPGTGKTTVARIMARLFTGLGMLEKGHTVETDRSGLVAEYAGQTGPRVNQRVDEALDGVLFIDEAYSLVASTGDDPFGAEAVQVLLKRMEDERHRLVVVLAGYPEPMQRLMATNPGLASRFQRTFTFPDYTADELLQIFEAMCKQHHYVLAGATRSKLREVFQTVIDRKEENFSNGRLARNLFERGIRRMANRLVKITPLTRQLLTTIEPEDIRLEDEG